MRFPAIGAEGFALTDGGELFVASSGENAVLSVFELATTYATRLTLSAPVSVPRNGTVNVTGNLQYGPGVPTALSVTRFGVNGTHDLGTVTTDVQGVVNFHDTPGILGRVLYRFSYTGDAEHTSVQADVRVVMRGLPEDVNGDGYADIAVAAPGENIGSTSNVGEIFVFYGSARGLSTGVVGGIYPSYHEAEWGFGSSLASGDFNGDGLEDPSAPPARP